MAGSHTAAARYFRTINISGNVYRANTAAASAAVNTTIASYALAGLFATIQFVPTTTQTASATVPAAPSTAANKGWQDINAEDATNQITWDAVDWSVRLRLLSSQNQSARFTVIVYRQNAGGTTEMGRGVSADLSLTTTVQTATVTIPVTAGLVFAAGDKIQVEVYCTTLTLGVATAPATATTITCRIEETEGNGGAKVSPSTYATQFVRANTTALSLTGIGARQIAASRPFSTALALAVAMRRGVAPAPKTAALSLVGALQKRVSPAAKSVALAVAASVQKTVVLPAKSVALSLTGTATRRIAAARSFSVALALGTVFARAVISARSFSDALQLAVSGLVQMPLSVLSRIVGGGGAIIKKLIAIFED